MNTIQIFNYNGNDVAFRKGESVMINATEMAKPFGKSAKHWLLNQATKVFIDELANVRNLTFADLVQVKQGSPENGGGTWLHEDVAMEFARWLSPAFAIWCNDRIKELMQIGFTATDMTIEAMVENPDLVISMATRLKQLRAENAEQHQQLTMQNEVIREQNKAINMMTPKANYYDVILNNPNTLTATEIASDYGMTATKFNKLLHEMQIQRKVNGSWVPYARYVGYGYTKIVTRPKPNSKTGGTYTHSQWTQSGRLFLYNMLKQRGILPEIERPKQPNHNNNLKQSSNGQHSEIA